MRIATWNINSIRTRKDRAVDFLIQHDVDVIALQETKCRNDQFPLEEFETAGYEVHHWGLNQWNGVAIASRLPMHDLEEGFPGMPGFDKNGGDPALEARAVAATIDGVRLWSVYVPNGRSLTDPHLTYKLQFLHALGEAVRSWHAGNPDIPGLVGGDFNIAPRREDVGDPAFVEGLSTHVSPEERSALDRALQSAQLVDLVRPSVPEGFTFWDYTQGKFPKNHGLRIDFLFGHPSLLSRVSHAEIVRSQRSGEQPSDHVPVVVDIEGEDSDDDRPMVF